MTDVAIVLAGGAGTRLRRAVSDVPKSMASVQGVPFLAILLRYLQRQGIERVVLALGYMHEAIVAHFGRRYGELEIRYSIEDQPLGTGGALWRALATVDCDDALVLNGDTFLQLDYSAMSAVHAASQASVTVAVRRVPDVARYGEVIVAESCITEFREKPGSRPGLVNGGVYLLSRALTQSFPMPPAFSFERDFLQAKVSAIRPTAFPVDGYFIDIGTPEDYARAQRELCERAGLLQA